MRIKLFVKEDCPRCPAAKLAVEDVADLEVYDIDDIDGLAEAAFHGVLATPSVLVLDSHGEEVASWRGQVPDRAQLRALMVN